VRLALLHFLPAKICETRAKCVQGVCGTGDGASGFPSFVFLRRFSALL
jgi:hypothetical protein